MTVIEELFVIILDKIIIFFKYCFFIIVLILMLFWLFCAKKINPKDQIETLNLDGVEITLVYPDKILPKEEKNCSLKLKLPDKTLNAKDKVEKKISVKFSPESGWVNIPKPMIEHRFKDQQKYREEKIPISYGNPDKLPEKFTLTVDIEVCSIQVQVDSLEIPHINHKESLSHKPVKFVSDNSYIYIQYNGKEVKKFKLSPLKNHKISQINITLNPVHGNIASFYPDKISFEFNQKKIKNEKEIFIKTSDEYKPNSILLNMELETVYRYFPKKKPITIEILDIPFYGDLFTNLIVQIFAVFFAILNVIMIVKSILK